MTAYRVCPPEPGEVVYFTFRHPANHDLIERPAMVVSSGVEGVSLCVFLNGRDDLPLMTIAERAGVIPRTSVHRPMVAPSETDTPEPGRWRRRVRRS